MLDGVRSRRNSETVERKRERKFFERRKILSFRGHFMQGMRFDSSKFQSKMLIKHEFLGRMQMPAINLSKSCNKVTPAMTEKLPFSIDEFLFQIHFHFHSGHKLIFYTFFARFSRSLRVCKSWKDFIHSTLWCLENKLEAKSFSFSF